MHIFIPWNTYYYVNLIFVGIWLSIYLCVHAKCLAKSAFPVSGSKCYSAKFQSFYSAYFLLLLYLCMPCSLLYDVQLLNLNTHLQMLGNGINRGKAIILTFKKYISVFIV